MAVGAGDAAAALLGLGIERPGTVLLNVGTGEQALTIIDQPDVSYTDRAFHQYRTVGPQPTGTRWSRVISQAM